MDLSKDTWKLGEKTFHSRIILGTARYPSPAQMKEAYIAAENEIITVSIRRVNLQQKEKTFLADDWFKRFHLLPNTSGCYTAKEAILVAQLAREATGSNWIKVEITGDETTLLPDPLETIKACEVLVKEGFVVLPYCSDDLVLCQRLEQVGCAAVMPLAAPIGSGLGIRNAHQLQLIKNSVSVPVIIDAGIGTASDACLAMELGCDAILLNTAVAEAEKPAQMGLAMKLAVQAGRVAFLSGRIPKIFHGKASSPLEDIIGS